MSHLPTQANQSLEPKRRSVLHLVVGASGVGKDTLIDAVRAHRPDIHVARRAITRDTGAVGEDHEALTLDAFEALETAGAFMLSWRAHGLAYGASTELLATLALPRHVMLNVSRSVLDDARRRYAPVRILNVTAPYDVRAQRLALRGRESEADIRSRLEREVRIDLAGPDVLTVENSGAREEGIAAMLAACAPPLSA